MRVVGPYPQVTERASFVTGYPYENIEPLQLLRYTDGQRYEPHFDYGEACDFEENMGRGHRHVTMLVYLNSVRRAVMRRVTSRTTTRAAP